MARLPIENGYLFVHIPKTAGTSFRDSLEEIFGDGLYCDYGADIATSPIVSDYIQNRQAFYEFGSFLSEQHKPVCLSGHYSVKKYAPFFYIKNIMLFLRNPVQRVISNYEHMRRVDGITESLESFCCNPLYMNLQSRSLGRVPFNLIGFIGLQEYYRESLQLLSFQLGLQVKESFLNINKERVEEKYKVDVDLRKLIGSNNQEDLVLYKRVKEIFLQRYELYSTGSVYIHGAIIEKTKYKIVGWAINQNSELPVELAIYVDGKEVGHVIANEYRPELRTWNVGRQAYIGFELSFEVPLTRDSIVECIVVDNGQELFSPFV